MSMEPKWRKEEEIEQLLARLRHQVAWLHRLEHASRHESDLRTSRRTIEELHWRLARLVANHFDASQSPCF
jgi:hypothetical protein